jgi:hypothetical protein
MSDACPWKPPMGWWIITREFGRTNACPSHPAAEQESPHAGRLPMHSVETSGLMNCIVS